VVSIEAGFTYVLTRHGRDCRLDPDFKPRHQPVRNGARGHRSGPGLNQLEEAESDRNRSQALQNHEFAQILHIHT
jgi:hypothetical protein